MNAEYRRINAAYEAAMERAAQQGRESVRVRDRERNRGSDHGNECAAAGQSQDQGFGDSLGHVVADLAQSLNVVLRMLERVFPAPVLHVDTHDSSPHHTVGRASGAVRGFGQRQ